MTSHLQQRSPAGLLLLAGKRGGGATKSGASEGSSGPTTRSSTRRTASAAAATSAVITAPAVTPAVVVSPSVGRTPTKAALKSYDAAQVGVASPMRDPLFPELEADPLGGDPYVDLFGEDSEGDDIPCGQQENMEKLFELAGRLSSQGHGLVEEDLLPPPVLTLANQPQPQPTPNVPPVFDIATLVAALKEANPPPPPQQPEMAQSILAITQSLVAISQKLDRPAAPEKRPRSPSLSPSRCSPPPSKRPHRREASPSPTRTRSGRSSPASLSPGQFSDQSDDEEDDQLADQVEEVFDPCGLPPVEAWSELDRELLGAASDKPAEPVARPEVPPPPQTTATASTSAAPATSVYARLGPPRDGSGDHTIPPHPDLTRSWRESWEAQDFKFSRPLEFVPVLHALAKVLKFSKPPSASPPPEVQWTQTVESTTKTQLLSVSQAQLARDQPSTSKQSGDRLRIPFKKGRGSGGKQNKKGKKGGGGSNSSSSESGGGRGAGRGRGRGRGGGAKKDAYSTYNTPKLWMSLRTTPLRWPTSTRRVELSPPPCATWHWTCGPGAGNTGSTWLPTTYRESGTSWRTPCPGGNTTTPRSGPSTRQWFGSYSNIGRLPMWISSRQRRTTNFQCSSQCAPLRRRAE